MRRSRSRSRRVEKLLLVAGLTGVGIWVGAIVRTTVSQHWSNNDFERKLAERPSAPKETPKDHPPAIEPGAMIGRLAIPRLQLHAIVREGADAHTLDLAVGHIPGTALPGQPGNVGVAGHRDSLFSGLGQVRKTDRIEFETLSGKYEYQVESTDIVKPQQVSVLNAGRYPEITLVTCYPFHYVGSAPNRFIVKARLISQGATGEAPLAAAHGSVRRQPSVRKVFFQVSEGHSRTLVPGVSFGVDWADASSQRVNGWMWVMPDRRTIRLTRQRPREPVVFYGYRDGKRRELVITSIGRNSVGGYLRLFG